MLQLLFAALLQLSLCFLVEAAPITTQGTAWQGPTGGGIVGFIVLVLDIIAWVEIIKSNRPPVNKVIWCLVVFLFPIIGMIIYYLFSNRQSHNSGGYEAIST
ncbi:hypothetical protein BU24DRAFT_463614 [Aaosphaeria arxii CBS 175.79]|uniref:Cardiolipin synthase N-terminal domain-containing protein n=1 Tax=Aaosphaeria arxii CBS 175.79 TaxID=1450172 RepID=A0A6A5XQ67_9PLEO|nr:uncharacterized protein BU24DRAFT_463614 [Aaosphaeria arxii CBS 175.79]KAF2014870.1 hypothetical protein BU24DRAFT_463614 [Aaosphaeria arxii CBS 175.79]